MKLMTYGNAKVTKGEGKGYLTAILHLAPARLSGFNTCPMASKGCAAACLNTAGRGIYQKTQNARIRRTKLFFNDRDTFMNILVWDIRAVERKASRQGFAPCIRLNGTSDIRWDNVAVTINGVEYANIMQAFPHIPFYDYTKRHTADVLPSNYSLTFSRSEVNETEALSALHGGMNTAVVFRDTLPQTWHGFTVIDGTKDDLRFLDPQGVVVGLLAKGKARRDLSGFVVYS